MTTQSEAKNTFQLNKLDFDKAFLFVREELARDKAQDYRINPQKLKHYNNLDSYQRSTLFNLGAVVGFGVLPLIFKRQWNGFLTRTIPKIPLFKNVEEQKARKWMGIYYGANTLFVWGLLNQISMMNNNISSIGQEEKEFFDQYRSLKTKMFSLAANNQAGYNQWFDSRNNLTFEQRSENLALRKRFFTLDGPGTSPAEMNRIKNHTLEKNFMFNDLIEKDQAIQNMDQAQQNLQDQSQRQNQQEFDLAQQIDQQNTDQAAEPIIDSESNDLYKSDDQVKQDNYADWKAKTDTGFVEPYRKKPTWGDR